MIIFDNADITKMKNEENRTNLKSVTIEGLFGRKDITLNFEKTVNIYVGENGLGKTTILNCVYYILKGDYEKLLNISFERISVRLSSDKKEYSFSKADLISYLKSDKRRLPYIYNEIYSYIEQMRFLHDEIEESFESIVYRISRKFDITTEFASRILQSYLIENGEQKKGDKNQIKSLKDNVSRSIEERVLYLTTYRRIEKDYSDYFTNEDREQRVRHSESEIDSLIRFGMKDVSKLIERILESIRFSTNQGFNKMTGLLLTKYINTNYNASPKDAVIDATRLQIVLNRLGSQISFHDKEEIIRKVENGEIENAEYSHLKSLLVELINNYNELQIYDEKIKMFSETCNRYLNGKSFVYDQSKLTLDVILNDVDEKIELSMLSSGEKQIVSLFSRLYLESSKECILLIDEPELSISLRWQKMLIPDIVKSGNCKLLLTVTHSPFIFDNEFDNDTKDIWYCYANKKGERN